MKVKIRRFDLEPNQTIGQLYINDEEFCFTLERPWINNKPNISCIPLGKYICKRVNSPKFGSTFEITDVEGRTHILFHKGNIWSDSHGCVLLGLDMGHLNGWKAVLDSGNAFNNFMGALRDVDEFELEIIV